MNVTHFYLIQIKSECASRVMDELSAQLGREKHKVCTCYWNSIRISKATTPTGCSPESGHTNQLAVWPARNNGCISGFLVSLL